MKLLVVLAFASAYADFSSFDSRYSQREHDGPYQPSGWRPSGPPLTLPLRQPVQINLGVSQRQQLPRQDFEPSGVSLTQQLPRQEFNPGSNFKGQQFNAPAQTYGAPGETYGPPSKEYGLPVTTEAEETTTEVPTTTESAQESEQLSADKYKQNEVKENEKVVEENNAVSQQGIYYIYHPTGLLQRVIYMTKDDVRNMAYTAQLKYENVEPIREPIYTYDPKTFVFRQLQV